MGQRGVGDPHEFGQSRNPCDTAHGDRKYTGASEQRKKGDKHQEGDHALPPDARLAPGRHDRPQNDRVKRWCTLRLVRVHALNTLAEHRHARIVIKWWQADHLPKEGNSAGRRVNSSAAQVFIGYGPKEIQYQVHVSKHAWQRATQALAACCTTQKPNELAQP